MTQDEGKKFFDEHMKYIYANDIDGMIDDQYAPDAVLISPFDIFPDKKPPHYVKGRQALKDFFRVYLGFQGSIDVEELTNFVAQDNSIFFQAIFSSKTGRWAVGDAWHMRGNQIEVHYSFAQRLGDPRPKA